MTDSAKDRKTNLYLMAEEAAVYESRAESQKALVLLNCMIDELEKEDGNKTWLSWAYAHKGAVENKQMVKVINMAADLYYCGYQDAARQIARTAIEKFETNIVDWFNKAIKARDNYFWAYSHLGEAYRQQAVRYYYLRVFQAKTDRDSEQQKASWQDLHKKEKEALQTAEENYKKGDRDDYWRLAHLGATNYYLAILNIGTPLDNFWQIYGQKNIKESIDRSQLKDAERNLKSSIKRAFLEKIVYPWAHVYLASVYGIEAKISQEDKNFVEAEKQWYKAFSTFVIALEEDRKIIARSKNITMLYERRMSIGKAKIEQKIELLGQVSEDKAALLNKEIQAEVQHLGELAATAKNLAKAELNDVEDLELHHYSLAIARLEHYQLTMSSEDNAEEEDEKQKKIDEHKFHFEESLSALEKCFNNSDANKTPIPLEELHEDYLRASLYLNQCFYEEKIKQPEGTNSLKANLEKAKKCLETAFLRSPKLLAKSYLDGTRDLYKYLQEGANGK